MKWRERRKLGLTLPNLCRAARAVEETGVQLRDVDRGDAAGLVGAQWVKHQGMDPTNPEIDWAAILAFIEQLLPLILAIIELFRSDQ